MEKIIVKCWAFRSQSDETKIYQTIQWSDGSLSCDCKGWTRRSIRQCKHTRSVELGIAEQECVSNVRPKTKVAVTTKKNKSRIHSEVRSFDW